MANSSNYQIISEPEELNAWCERTAGVPWIGLDTEFIAERYYQPLLCLIQVATPDGHFLIDPITNRLDSTPFWNLLVEGEHETIVHAGRLELEFCWRHTGRFPKRVFDTQIATGFVSSEYPAGYGNVISHFLHINTPGTESRSNWKTRPLTSRQIAYAIDDIAYLHDVHEVLMEELVSRNRLDWFRAEIEEWIEENRILLSPERWRRILNGSRWDPHELAVVHELWDWRDRLARQRNCSARHVLRDDLILELARRKISDVHSIRNIRGMERDDLRGHLSEISEAIVAGISLPTEECPTQSVPHHHAKLTVLGALLYSILGTICHQYELAPALVATPTAVREWVAWRLKMNGYYEKMPSLSRGWRAEIIGKTFDALLSGQQMVRIVNPVDPFPIEFVEWKPE